MLDTKILLAKPSLIDFAMAIGVVPASNCFIAPSGNVIFII
jgi:hypothetical protein